VAMSVAVAIPAPSAVAAVVAVFVTVEAAVTTAFVVAEDALASPGVGLETVVALSIASAWGVGMATVDEVVVRWTSLAPWICVACMYGVRWFTPEKEQM
jgi:hypothetical protein